MDTRLYQAIQANPIIAAIRDDEGLEGCLKADVQIVFVLYGDICSIGRIVERIKNAGKMAIVHVDLITGLSGKEICVDFLRNSTRADGIISTRVNMIQRAKELVEELSSADITAHAREIAQMSASSVQHKAVAKPDEVDLNQMSIFDTVKDDDIIKELGDLELSTMTPIDALNTLYRLQTRLKNRWQ